MQRINKALFLVRRESGRYVRDNGNYYGLRKDIPPVYTWQQILLPLIYYLFKVPIDTIEFNHLQPYTSYVENFPYVSEFSWDSLSIVWREEGKFASGINFSMSVEQVVHITYYPINHIIYL